MLFEKDMEPRCAYCKRGVELEENEILCSRKGIVSPMGSCRKFKYDPLKRVPPKPLAADFSHLKEEDFVL